MILPCLVAIFRVLFTAAELRRGDGGGGRASDVVLSKCWIKLRRRRLFVCFWEAFQIVSCGGRNWTREVQTGLFGRVGNSKETEF